MAEFRKVSAGEVTVIKLIGTPTLAEVIEALEQLYATRPTRYVVWDLSEGSVELLDAGALHAIQECVLRYTHLRSGGKTALVAPADLEYGVSRILGTRAQVHDVSLEVRVFRSLGEAAYWLGIAALPKVD